MSFRGAAVLMFGIPLGVLLAGGCGGVDPSSYCQAAEACTGGTSDDVKACEDEYKSAQNAAGDVGCTAEFKALFNCNAGAATCRTVPVGVCSPNIPCAQGTCTGGQCMAGVYGVEATGGQQPCQSQSADYTKCLTLSVQ